MLERLPPLDLSILASYLLAVVGMSLAFAWRQRTGQDYFLAGRSMGAVPLAFSIMANQASAVSLVGAPAFVALREGGGLRWLQYELAVPVAMLLLSAVLYLSYYGCDQSQAQRLLTARSALRDDLRPKRRGHPGARQYGGLGVLWAGSRGLRSRGARADSDRPPGDRRSRRRTRRNLAVAWLAPSVPWLWWNPAGFVVAMVVAFAEGKPGFRWEARWERGETALLLGAFALMVVVLAVLPNVVALLH